MQYLQDAIGHRRHTLDLRAARADVVSVVQSTPAFHDVVRVSRYRFGIRPKGSTTLCTAPAPCIEQLQFNVPNLPLFRLGSAPFLGDYIDVTGYSRGNAPVYHFVWTDNRDVRPPKNGNWATYTAPNSTSKGTTSLFTGGSAVGWISTRSMPDSSASASASSRVSTPTISPSAPITRTRGTRISLFLRLPFSVAGVLIREFLYRWTKTGRSGDRAGLGPQLGCKGLGCHCA
jgi:hypothetical protein